MEKTLLLAILILMAVAAILIFGIFIRFYKLDWGEGYFFHPDEYHIARAVNELHFPDQMNPHLFSYGSFSVYSIYFLKSLWSFLASYGKLFTEIISPFLVGRFLSATYSSLNIYVVYLIAKNIFISKKQVLLATFFTAILPGIIQQAHFATPESTVIFFLTLTLYLLLLFIKGKKEKFVYLSALTLGIAIATKITSFLFSPLILITLLLGFRKNLLKNSAKIVKITLLSFLFLFSVFIIFFPYSLLDYTSFRNSLNYESAVATGKQIVFYNRQFIDTIPLKFQLTKIFPYAIGVPLTIFGILGFLKLFFEIIKKPLPKWTLHDKSWILIIFSFLNLLIPNSLLFAKWTRFVSPTFVYFPFFTVYFLSFPNHKQKLKYVTSKIFLFLTIISSAIWFSMFFSIYLGKDVRIKATDWVKDNIPAGSIIFTETGNTLEVPLTGSYSKIPFDFYHLEENPRLKTQLISDLARSDYFIIQSRRIYMNHERFPDKFPTVSNFYSALFSEKLGFAEIIRFNSFPKLEIGDWRLEIGDEIAEETWSVFDHPTIRIYKKIHPLAPTEYEKILNY